VLALLGRELRDFLNGLDNLHEYLKFSYPRYTIQNSWNVSVINSYLYTVKNACKRDAGPKLVWDGKFHHPHRLSGPIYVDDGIGII
jgi:hypothetical protein